MPSNQDGSTPLHLLVEAVAAPKATLANRNFAEAIVTCFATTCPQSLNTINAARLTPLQLALFKETYGMARQMLVRGANVSTRHPETGQTVLHACASITDNVLLQVC